MDKPTLAIIVPCYNEELCLKKTCSILLALLDSLVNKNKISDNSYIYTFNNLEAGTSYNISVQVVDKAGNVNTINKEIQVDSLISKDVIIADNNINQGNPNFANTSCASGCMELTNGLYTSEDDYGISYYFRGSVNNNWVKFAGFYWRII